MKKICLLSSFFFFIFVSASFGSEPKGAFFMKEGSNVVLKEGTKEGSGAVVQEWTAGEWQAQRHLMEGTRECLDNAYADCMKALLERKTGMKDPITPGEAESARGLAEDARAVGDELDTAVTKELDIPSEAGGFLDLPAAGTALGVIALGPLAFKLGVDIGNGLDQLFGIPELELSPETPPEVKTGTCVWEHREAFTINDSSKGGETFTFEPGYYGNCHVVGGGVKRRFESRAITECETEVVFEGSEIEGANHSHEMKTTDEGGAFEPICKESVIRRQFNLFQWWIPEEHVFECNPRIDSENFFKTTSYTEPENEGAHACIPSGVPSASGLSTQVKKNNKEHTKSEVEVPKSTPATLPAPGKAPLLPEKEMEKALEILPAKTWIKTHTKTTIKHMREEEESATIEIPAPEPSEVGTHYVTRVGELGFTNVVTEVLPETAIDVTVGPNEVSKVVPAPHTFVSPSTKVTVEVNPEDAPTPGELPGGIGPPTLPGIHFPSFPVLCKGFPFGVPCWLISSIEGWSSPGICPEWGIENLEIDGKHITGKFDLCKLEPIMAKVRPAMLLFATFGLVLLFFNFAKGGGAPSGSQSDSPNDVFSGGLSNENDPMFRDVHENS